MTGTYCALPNLEAFDHWAESIDVGDARAFEASSRAATFSGAMPALSDRAVAALRGLGNAGAVLDGRTSVTLGALREGTLEWDGSLGDGQRVVGALHFRHVEAERSEGASPMVDVLLSDLVEKILSMYHLEDATQRVRASPGEWQAGLTMARSLAKPSHDRQLVQFALRALLLLDRSLQAESLLRSDNPHVRETGVLAARLGHESEAVDHMLALHFSWERDLHVRWQIVNALWGRIAELPQGSLAALRAVLPTVADPPSARLAALLAGTGDRSGLDWLLAQVRSSGDKLEHFLSDAAVDVIAIGPPTSWGIDQADRPAVLAAWRRVLERCDRLEWDGRLWRVRGN